MISRISVKNIQGTRCYCDTASECTVRDTVRSGPLSGIHYIGSGDYHYITFFEMERITEPFALILIDNHSDDQNGAFDSDTLSCGNWVLHARKRLSMMKESVFVRRSSDSIGTCGNLPVYLSVDLDVLSEEYADTNWDQGEMTIRELYGIIRNICRTHRILGIDVCGAPENDEESSKNENVLIQITKAAEGQTLPDLS